MNNESGVAALARRLGCGGPLPQPAATATEEREMLRGRLGLETARIPHADRHGLLWLSRGALTVRDGTLRFERNAEPDSGSGLDSGDYGIPFQSLSMILLGPGSTVSHDALRLMARHGTALVAVGEDGVRCYTAPPLMPDTVQKTRNSKPKAQRKSKPKPQMSPPKPRAAKQPKPKRETSPVKQKVPMSPEERLQHRRAYEQKRSQTPERKELNRRTALAKRQEAKRLGLCVGCGSPPIPDETRCETCAEKHREGRRKYQKRAKNQAAQPEIQESDQTTFL